MSRHIAFPSLNAVSIIALFALMGCGSPKTNDQPSNPISLADSIVSLSIQAHGGWDAWQNLQAISFSKTTTLYDSMGVEESTITQRQQFTLKPQLEGIMAWREGEDSIRIVYSPNGATKYMNGELESGTDASNTVMASLFVLFQPFKLLDEGTRLEYMGSDTLAGVPVDVIRPLYPGADENSDQWLFYFDKETHELIFHRVNHNGRISLIQSMTFDTTSPLRFHGHRRSYFVDKQNEIKYLRAEYYYTDYQVDFKPN